MYKKTSFAKKAFSVLLAVMMVLTVGMMDWSVLFTKADAAVSAGSYKVKVFCDVSNGAKLNSSDMRLYYKKDNGTASSTEYVTFKTGGDSSGDWYDDGGDATYEFTVNGFPDHAYFSYQIEWGGRKLEFTAYIYVYNNLTKQYVQLSSNSYSDKSGATSSSNFSHNTTTISSNKPKISDSSTISLDKASITAEAVGGSAKTVGGTCNFVDQYGVAVKCDPQWSLGTDNWGGCTVSDNTNDTGTLTIPATHKSSGTQTVQMKASASFNGNSVTKTASVTVTPTYKLTFNASQNGGLLSGLTTGSVTFTNTTNSGDYSYTFPTNRKATKTDWTFKGWAKSKDATTSGVVAPGNAMTVGYNDTVYAIYNKEVKATYYYIGSDGYNKSVTKSYTAWNNATSGTMPVPYNDVNTQFTLDGRAWTFDGWRSDTTSTAPTNPIGKTDTSKTLAVQNATYKYYAVYKNTALTLSYDGNGGTPVPAAQTATQYLTANGGSSLASVNDASSGTFTVNPNEVIPSRVGTDAFLGWKPYSSADIESEEPDANYANGKSISFKANSKLMAIYKITREPVTFLDYDGTVLSTGEVKYDDGSRTARYEIGAPLMSTKIDSVRPGGNADHVDAVNHYVFDKWVRSDGKAVANIINGTNISANIGYVTSPITVKATYKGVGHHWVTLEDNYKPATCDEAGYYSRKCSDCGYVQYNVPVEALGHLTITEGAKAATCENPGNSGTTYCTRCYEVIQEATVIPALGHDYNLTSSVPATCTALGYDVYTCSHNASHTYKVYGAEMGEHNIESHDAIPATCTATGVSEWSECSICHAQVKAPAILPMLGHDLEAHAFKAATCLEDGNLAYFECKNCGKLYADKKGTLLSDVNGDGVVDHDDTVLAAPGSHDYENLPASDATCTEPGYTAGRRCTRCGDIPEGEEVQIIGTALDHEFGEPVVVPSTCSVAGTSTRTCARCHCEDVTELALAEHDLEEIAAVPATCTEYGKTAYTKCKNCDYVTAWKYTAKAEHSYVETAAAVPASCEAAGCTAAYECSECHAVKAAVEIPAVGHKFGGWVVSAEASCGVAGMKEHKCSVCGKLESEEIPALEHDWIVAEAKDATCTEDGNTAGKYCALCGETADGYEVIAASGHTWSDTYTVVKPATCKEAGWEVRGCAACDATEGREIAKLDHAEENIVTIAAIPATCTTIGYTEGKKCSECGEILVPVTATAKKAHTPKTEEGFAATCTAAGKADSVVCEICGTVISEGKEIKALGHTWGDWTLEQAATCEANGIRVRYCTCEGCEYASAVIDNALQIRELPVLGHNIVTDEGKAATCTKDGLTAGSHCTRCDAMTEAQVVIPATGHKYGSVVTEPTCTKRGYTVYTCEYCSGSYKGDYVDAKGHTGGTATCTEKAVCSECGNAYGELKDHDYVYTFIEGTCKVKGINHYECSACHDTYEVEGEYGAHQFTDYTVVTPATCTSEGVAVGTCTVCGLEETAPIPKTEHMDADGDKYCDDCHFDLDPSAHQGGEDDPSSSGSCDLCGMNHDGKNGGFFGRNGFICKIVAFFHRILNLFK